MEKINLKTIEQWCQDAASYLPTPKNITEMTHESIKRHANNRKFLFMIADDLAEGLSFLPKQERDIAQKFLIEKHGFGYDFFTDKRMSHIRAIIKRGKIRNEDEYRTLLNAANNTTLESALLDMISQLLANYESSSSSG